MYRLALIVIAMATGVQAAPLGAQGGPAPTSPPAIVASGHGESVVTPDRATVFITVETHAATAAGAASDNAKRVRVTLDTLHALGLTREQLSTAGYSVSADYRYDKGAPHVVGYVARNTIRAEVKQIDQVGRVIDAALAGGANSIGNVEFTASTMDDARHSALATAVAQARGDADAMAKAAGGSVGPLLELSSEATSPGPRPMFLPRLAAAEVAPQPTQLQPGDITVGVTVTGRWAFVR